MSAPGDVLAAWDRALPFLEGLDGVHGDAVAARAAVAELIEALRSAADRLGVLIECDNEDHGDASEDDVAAYKAARAALARAGAAP